MDGAQTRLELEMDDDEPFHASPCSAILDVTMGHRGMQKEANERFGIHGPLTSIDIREEMGNGMRPDFVMDSRKMTFPDSSFDMVLFDPPFSFHGPKSCGGAEYNRFYVTYGLDIYHTRQELAEYLRDTFREIARVMTNNGQCLLKWSESRIPLTFPLSLRGKLRETQRWRRPSKHWGTKTGTDTWYTWLSLPNV